jgi:hypothetical protein
LYGIDRLQRRVEVRAVLGLPGNGMRCDSATGRRLKHHYGLAILRVRGIERVRLHADLVVLARLSQALSRARAIPLAA